MAICESGFSFDFPAGATVKFDDTQYYRNNFNALSGGKGVDILHASDSSVIFLEIKNCLGNEADNRWRLGRNNSKLHLAQDKDQRRDSFDVEMAQKTAMTLACLTGAAISRERRETTEKVLPFFDALMDGKISACEKKFHVILFLEGNFSSKTRTKKMQMQELQASIRNKLRWLNCTVSVVDSSTYPSQLFQVSRQTAQ